MTEQQMNTLKQHIRESGEAERLAGLLGIASTFADRSVRLSAFWADIEARSADAHAVYQREAHRRGDVRHPDAYEELSEPTKEWDRVLVRWVRESCEAILDGKEPPKP